MADRSARRLFLPAVGAGRHWDRRFELLLILVAVGLPVVVSGYQLQLFTHVAILCLLALSLDIVWGYGGVLDLGRAALFGWPAYLAAILATRVGMTNGFVAIVVSAAAGALLALAVSVFLFVGQRQYRGIFVAMATLVLAYASERLASAWPAVGSANGIPNVPLMSISPLPGDPIGPGVPFYAITTGLLALTYVGLKWLVNSQFGLVLAAARERDRRVAFIGYSTSRFRIVTYTLSGAIAGIAGALYAFHEGYVAPDVLGVNLSTQAVLWVLIGGRGRLLGAIVGTIVMSVVSTQLSGSLQVVWQIVLGLLLVVLLTTLPGGLTGPFLARRATDFARRGTRP